jgi:hypothetical protein
MTVRELHERLDSVELSEWLAFDCEYGLPDAYFATAQLGKAVMAPWAKSPPAASDFVPFFEPQAPARQSTAQHKAFFLKLAEAGKQS